MSNPYPFPFPMSPFQSWMLVISAMALAVLLAYLLWGFDVFCMLASRNAKIVGAKGVWYALRGKECYEIKQEYVVEVTKREDDGYAVRTSDGDNDYEYVIMATTTDAENPKYWEALELTRSDPELRDYLLPDNHVKHYIALHDTLTDSSIELFIVYVKHDEESAVEEAMNAYFKEVFDAEVAAARKSKTLVA